MARRTKEDALATRSALLDAAERVFLQRGVSRTSLADIAQAAGVTRGALYWHFKDKAALFNAMLDRVALPMNAELQDLLARAGDPLAPWCAHVRDMLHQIEHDARTRHVLQIAMQKVEYAEELGPVIDRHIEMYRLNNDWMRQVLERAAVARGRPLPTAATQLAHGFHATVHGLIYSWLLDRSFGLEATGQVVIEAYLRGIGLALDAPPPAPVP
ncbi:MAG: TetR family transcriptional regulator [Burkholderiaceae bacterium]